MALQKTKTARSGASVSYHRIVCISFEKSRGVVEISIASHTEAPGSLEAVEVSMVHLSGQSACPSSSEAYAAVKTQPEWSDATDA